MSQSTQAASNEPTFRDATAEDQAVVVGLMRELVDELGPLEMASRVKPLLDDDIAAALGSADVVIILATAGNEVVGLSRGDILEADPIFRLREDHRCGYIDQMFVRPQHRGSGLGLELLRRCEAWFKERGIGHALLHAAPRATRFYARHGYRPNREMFRQL